MGEFLLGLQSIFSLLNIFCFESWNIVNNFWFMHGFELFSFLNVYGKWIGKLLAKAKAAAKLVVIHMQIWLSFCIFCVFVCLNVPQVLDAHPNYPRIRKDILDKARVALRSWHIERCAVAQSWFHIHALY